MRRSARRGAGCIGSADRRRAGRAVTCVCLFAVRSSNNSFSISGSMYGTISSPRFSQNASKAYLQSPVRCTRQVRDLLGTAGLGRAALAVPRCDADTTGRAVLSRTKGSAA